MQKQILLNFDLEEFDIPKEYGQDIDSTTMINVSSKGLTNLLNLLDKFDIRATFFTTVYFAKHAPSIIQRIIQKHELASHSVSHSKCDSEDLIQSRIELEKLSDKKIYGFRQPRLESIDNEKIQNAGYIYNSSENPIWLPGRYMNLFKPRLPYYSGKLLNLPISTSPIIRYPLFWLSFKNSPLWLFKIMSGWALEKDGYLNIFFHPWEFTDISMWRLPGFVKNPCGEKMLIKLEKYLTWLKEKAPFVTCASFSETFS